MEELKSGGGETYPRPLFQHQNQKALRPLSRVANATWAAANVALSGSKLAAKVQVNATALLPGQITCYYDEVSGIVTSVDDGSGPSCGRYLNAVPVKLGGTKYVSWIDVQLVKGTPYVGRLTFWVKDATTPTFAKGSVKAGGALPYAVRCGRVDDDYLDKALDGLAHAESWPSALTDVEEALESNTQTPLGTAATAEQRKAALASQFAFLSAAEGNAKAAAKYNATAKRILAPKRGRGLATLRASCFSNVRAPVDFAEVADAMRISPLTGARACWDFSRFFPRKKRGKRLTLFFTPSFPLVPLAPSPPPSSLLPV